MRYRRDYQETHDIDWFFKYKGKAYHAASNGGMLPDVIDSNINRELQEKLEDSEGQYPVDFAEDAHNRIKMGEDLSSFAEYASKGFISLDRVEVEDEKDIISYYKVAYPKKADVYIDEELLKLMPELKDEAIYIQ